PSIGELERTIVDTLVWLILLVAVPITLAYRRVPLGTSTLVLGALLVAYLLFGDGHWLFKLLLLVVFAAFASLNAEGFRRENVTRRILDVYRRMLPSMSRTEQEALEAGNVWWEGELF